MEWELYLKYYQHCRPGFNPGPRVTRHGLYMRHWTPDFRFAPSGETLSDGLQCRLSERLRAANGSSQI